MRNTLRAQGPVTALAAFTIIATAGLLSACSAAHSGGPAAQQSPQTSPTPVSQQTPVSQPSPASPAPATASQPRPRAGHLDPASFSMVTVSADVSMDGSPLRVHNSYRSPAVIARLARIVNGLPAAKPASASCPSAMVTYRLSFTAMGSGPGTTVTTTNCRADRISVDGTLRQPLWDRSGAVAAAVKHMLKLKLSFSSP